MLFTLIIVYYLVQKLFNKPLSQLMEGVKVISEGNLEHNVPIYSMDEIGLLAYAFNGMSGKLKTKENDLKAKMEELHSAPSTYIGNDS